MNRGRLGARSKGANCWIRRLAFSILATCSILVALTTVCVAILVPSDPDPVVLARRARVSTGVTDALYAHIEAHGTPPNRIEELAQVLSSELRAGLAEDDACFSYQHRLSGGWRLTFWLEREMYTRDSEIEGLWISGDYDENYPRARWRPVEL